MALPASNYSCSPGGTLSCDPGWAIRLTGPGGFPTYGVFDMQAITGSMERRLDATAKAQVTVLVESTNGRQCCEILATGGRMQGWKLCELEIWRDGICAFAGPITFAGQKTGLLSIEAHDETAWWHRRRTGDMVFKGVDLASIFASVHAAAMIEDPIPNFAINPSATGILADRTYLDKDDKYAIEIIDELSRTGIDWTAYGRQILVGGQTVEVAPTVTLTDEDWGGDGPEVQFAGERYATEVLLRGAGDLRARARLSNFKEAGGLVTRVFNDETIEDQASLNAGALSRLEVLSNPWRVVTPDQSTLKCGAPIAFAALIAGARIRIQTAVACEDFSADFRLTTVTADLGTPDVQVALAPLGVGGFADSQSVSSGLD